MTKKTDISSAIFGTIASAIVVLTASHEIVKETYDRSNSIKKGDKKIAIFILIVIVLLIIIHLGGYYIMTHSTS